MSCIDPTLFVRNWEEDGCFDRYSRRFFLSVASFEAVVRDCVGTREADGHCWSHADEG